MKRQQEKQPSVLPSAFTHKSAFGDREKREQGNDGIRERPTKKIITVQRCKEQKQNVTNMARIVKKKMEAQKQTKAKSEVVKQIAAETNSATKAKKEAQKESVAELASTFKDKKKALKQNVAERVSTPQKVTQVRAKFQLITPKIEVNSSSL